MSVETYDAAIKELRKAAGELKKGKDNLIKEKYSLGVIESAIGSLDLSADYLEDTGRRNKRNAGELKNCDICGKEVETYRTFQKYCSNSCRQKAYRKRAKERNK